MLLHLLLAPLFAAQGSDYLLKDQLFGQKALELFGFASAEGGDVNGDGLSEWSSGAVVFDAPGAPDVGVLFLYGIRPGTLTVEPIFAGGTATFHVPGDTSAAKLHLAWSRMGRGPTGFPNFGFTLDLSKPIQVLTPFLLDFQGNGALGPLPVPPFVPSGTSIWFQGVVQASAGLPLTLTNMVPVQIL